MVPRLVLQQSEVHKIRQVLDEEISPGLSQDGFRNPEFQPQALPLESVTRTNGNKTSEIPRQFRFRHVYTEDKTSEHIKHECMTLFTIVENHEDDYLDQLDKRMSLRLKCSFERVQDTQETVRRACKMLERLPNHAPSMNDDKNLYLSMLGADLIDDGADATWENFRTARFLDRNTIRIALYLATHDYKHQNPFTPSLLTHINHIARLLEGTVALGNVESDPTRNHAWFRIKTALWTSWHRSILLHLSAELRICLFLGFAGSRESPLEFECTQVIAKLSSTAEEIPQYMCRWAYELVRTDRASVALDLRLFHKRHSDYSQLRGISKPRCCISDSGTLMQCDGTSPQACDRFRRMKVEDQSLHAGACPRETCRRLYWKEDSYRSIQGPRAVSLFHDGSDGSLLYRLASKSTMTVSHVWSHGQGGNPDVTGLNSCLHRRYCNIARKNGFDSYWIDSACIPTDPILRTQAISEINGLFWDSEMTLVCDRDIMDLGIRPLTTEMKETLLSVLLVCDWNVRAWTFLEAMRGRTNLHLLCKSDEVVSLRSLIHDVNLEGSIEIAAPFVTSQHLLPGTPERFRMPGLYKPEYVLPEEGACMLNRRYTTKPGDGLIIWSLLCGETVHKTGESLWQSQRRGKGLIVGNARRPKGTVMGRVYTGFLVSSAPRVPTYGFRWAPSRPDLAYDPLADSGPKSFHVYDGKDTPSAFFDDQGLEGQWLTYEFPGPGYTWTTKSMLLLPFFCDTTTMPMSPLQRMVFTQLHGFRWGAILQAIDDKAAPLILDKIAAPTRGNPGNPTGHAVVLVGSQDRVDWEWLGVYEMNEGDLQYLEFDRKEINIV